MSTEVASESSTPVFLHVGCGPKQKDQTPFAKQNWREIRLDIDSAIHPDVIGTMTDMKAVDDASVDAVFLLIILSTFILMKFRSPWPSFIVF